MACSRTVNWPAVTPVSCPSTQGCASSSRRPTLKASRCARPPYRVLVGKPDRAAPQPVSIVDPYRVRRGNQDIRSALRTQQWLQDADAGELGLQHPQIAQHLGIAKHSARFGTDRGGDDVGTQRRGFGRQPLTDPVDQRHTHAASADGCCANTVSTRRAAVASGDR